MRTQFGDQAGDIQISQPCFFCHASLGNCHNVQPGASRWRHYGSSPPPVLRRAGEYVRVRGVGPTLIPPGMHIEDAVLLTDVVPTGYQAAEMGDIKEDDTVVVFGAGPIGIMAARCAWLMGAGRVIVVDHVDYRLEFVQRYAQCEVVNSEVKHWRCTHADTEWRGATSASMRWVRIRGNFAQASRLRIKLQGCAATALHWRSTPSAGRQISIVASTPPSMRSTHALNRA